MGFLKNNMVNGKSCGIGIFVILILSMSCQQRSKEIKIFAKIGQMSVSQDQFDVFKKMREYYPAYINDRFFPNSRPEATLFVELELIYPKAKSSIEQVRKSRDWYWKELFFPAQVFSNDILQNNLGFTNTQIQEYYTKNKESYRQLIKIVIDTAAKNKHKDSSKTSTKAGDTLTKKTKDSVSYLPLTSVRDNIIKKLFLQKYPPDSLFFAQMRDSSEKNIDTVRIQNLWVNQVRRNIHDFFMKKFYQQRFNKPYPDSLADVYGDSKLITPADMEVILGWLSEDSRESYKTPERQRFLIEWLIKWKLFAQESEKFGYKTDQEVKSMSEFAFKFDVVQHYIYKELLPQFSQQIQVDTVLALYEAWDKYGNPGVTPGKDSLKEVLESNRDLKIIRKLDDFIYTLRKNATITYIQADISDDKTKDPEKLSKDADSLYAAGNSKDAEKLYRVLVDNFVFTNQGLAALVELAKIMTENENYSDAVTQYRKFLLFSPDQQRWCNIFFMIGFVYGEYLAKPELAEVNYKWIMKNAPGCELVDDAEFMYLHLDEPMIGVDELQNETKRQGKADTSRQDSNQEQVAKDTSKKS